MKIKLWPKKSSYNEWKLHFYFFPRIIKDYYTHHCYFVCCEYVYIRLHHYAHSSIVYTVEDPGHRGCP